uniref:G_PROTEIN_RECEP_F1_2 domain-containing protein n=1 Tax=Panagrellus redivivus TaxID=6233 RepID=A0A7E4VMU2_PANRE
MVVPGDPRIPGQNNPLEKAGTQSVAALSFGFLQQSMAAPSNSNKPALSAEQVHAIVARTVAKIAKNNKSKIRKSTKMPMTKAEKQHLRRMLHRSFTLVVVIVILIPLIVIALNCAYDKPFIPKSQGFCNDAVHLFTKYEVRKTLVKNYHMTMNNFEILVIDTATSYVVNATKSIDENLQKFCCKAVTFYNNTLGQHVKSFSELIAGL